MTGGNLSWRLLTRVAVLVGAAVSGMTYWATHRTNHYVEEGNALIDRGNALSGQVGPQIAGLFKQEALADFPKRREQRSAAARQTLDLLTKCAACYREAADKFEEASRQGVDNEVREYLSLQAKATRKLAEVKAGVMDMVKLLLDESVGDVQTLEARMGPLGQALDAMSHDADVLADQAKKVCADHPTRFATLQRG